MDSDGGSPGRIVVATDGSSAAQAAAGLAIDWAAALQSPVRALYVVDSGLIWHEFADYRRELGLDGEEISREEAVACFEEQGDLALRWIEQRCRSARVAVSGDLLLGSVSDVLRQNAQGSRLLAIGKRGQAHAHDSGHLGRHLRSIAHHAPVPLLVAGEDVRPVRRLLLVLENGHIPSGLLDWTKLLHGKISVEAVALESQGEGERSGDELGDRLSQLGLTSNVLVDNQLQDAAGILGAAERYQADLILMGRDFRHHGLRERFAERVADSVLAGTRLPVLLA